MRRTILALVLSLAVAGALWAQTQPGPPPFGTVPGDQTVGGNLDIGGNLTLGGTLLISATEPTLSGFGTSPSVTAFNGTAAFAIDVGTGGVATTGTITLPAATTGWNCYVENVTGTGANRLDQRTVQTGGTTTTAVVQNQTVTTGVALVWTASDELRLACFAF